LQDGLRAGVPSPGPLPLASGLPGGAEPRGDAREDVAWRSDARRSMLADRCPPIDARRSMPADRRSGRITGEDVRAGDASLSGEHDSRAKGRRRHRPSARCSGPREAREMTAFLLSPPPPTVALD
jgi:hypothetical protein